jgi:copper chaperone
MTRLSVPDMNCGHCKASVLTALSALPDVGQIVVDLDQRQVEANASPAAMIAALAEIGFEAKVLQQNQH